MKKIIVLLFVIVLPLSFSQNAKAQPRMEVIGGDTCSWGVVKAKREILTKNLVIKNTGNSALIIEKVQPTCGCTNAPISKNTIMPGDTALLAIELKIQSHIGTLKKTIAVTSNDPTSSPKTLTLIADIDRAVQFRPFQYFAFTGMKVRKETSTTLLLKNASSEDMVITDIVLPEDITINIEKNTKVSSGQEIELIIIPLNFASDILERKQYLLTIVKYKLVVLFYILSLS